jgi:hypothetical protein
MLKNKKDITCVSSNCQLDVVIIRIINGELYYDWPWELERIKNRNDYSHLRIFKFLLNIV